MASFSLNSPFAFAVSLNIPFAFSNRFARRREFANTGINPEEFEVGEEFLASDCQQIIQRRISEVGTRYLHSYYA